MENRLKLLNEGIEQTNNLQECLQVDQFFLLSIILKKYLPIESHDEILKKLSQDIPVGILKQMKSISSVLVNTLSLAECQSLYSIFSTHPSDTVRGWACFMLNHFNHMIYEQKLNEVQRFAIDSHFGVREWAWLALRDQIALNLEDTINLYKEWVISNNLYIRRFAIESIRPRGVWCSHINVLKNTPELALPLLEKLNNDSEKYVQDSVSNWLNDASKTQPEWVKKVCKQWGEKNPSPHMLRIIKRSLRTINSKKEK